MEDRPIASVILDEAQGAHRASRKILELMEDHGEGEDSDPIEKILSLLHAIHGNQATMLTRLEIIERRLASRA